MAASPADIPPPIRAHIADRLAAVEREHGVRILYAAESGSRAWGFGSPDSDFDVRFIYAHDRDWYLRLVEPRDVIEKGIDAQLIDLNGWDVRKALRLLLKSNPALYEWLVSPIVYRDDGRFREAASATFREQVDRRALAFHYWSIARGQWRSEIEGRDEVKLKKYFYVVRPLLSLGWTIAEPGPPPMQIDALLDAVAMPGEIRRAVDDLLVAKRQTPELGLGPRIGVIDGWAIDRLEAWKPDAHDFGDAMPRTATAQVDALFRATIGVG